MQKNQLTASILGASLTAKQRLLVDTLVTEGCTIKAASIKAGYSDRTGSETARAAGSRALRLPHVQEYQRQRILEEFSTAAPAALRTLVRLVKGGDSEYVQMQAASTLLDRAGYGKVDNVTNITAGNISIHIDLSDD